MALRLKRHGITRVRPLQGGLGLWMDSQLPIEKLRDPTSARESAAYNGTLNVLTEEENARKGALEDHYDPWVKPSFETKLGDPRTLFGKPYLDVTGKALFEV